MSDSPQYPPESYPPLIVNGTNYRPASSQRTSMPPLERPQPLVVSGESTTSTTGGGGSSSTTEAKSELQQQRERQQEERRLSRKASTSASAAAAAAAAPARDPESFYPPVKRRPADRDIRWGSPPLPVRTTSTFAPNTAASWIHVPAGRKRPSGSISPSARRNHALEHHRQDVEHEPVRDRRSRGGEVPGARRPGARCLPTEVVLLLLRGKVPLVLYAATTANV
ncbi:hypothetical protein F4809DRAFT_638064 [Biscogniauxia mediterranea]|nr:hypothetical protein F4809DRAFT_638064 [Biscogniauxia mediterranea]